MIPRLNHPFAQHYHPRRHRVAGYALLAVVKMNTKERKMKPYAWAMLAGLLAGCGNSAVDGELIGQAKKVALVTPLICPNYYAFDASLGVMRNGTGSMSTQDMWFTIERPEDVAALRAAAEKGLLVKIHYNTRRVAFCTEQHIMTGFEVTQ